VQELPIGRHHNNSPQRKAAQASSLAMPHCPSHHANQKNSDPGRLSLSRLIIHAKQIWLSFIRSFVADFLVQHHWL
jgi:hypothetical protein